MDPLSAATSALATRYGLPPARGAAFAALLRALAAEPDPPTTVRDPVDAIDRHLADSLEGIRVPAIAGARRIADLGAGAGFPGLALAVALPDAEVHLVESVARKCATIERLAAAAGLANASALAVRAEELGAGAAAGSYDAVTARAVAPLAVLVEYAAPLLSVGGALVAWKGARDETEEAAGAAAAALVGLEAGDVVPAAPFPGVRDRNLHVYLKVTETPERFPRRPGIAAKRPLA